jgi:Uma2 family endonuclease
MLQISVEEVTNMTQFAYSEVAELSKPDISHLVTEDDEPVDNFFSAKQQRLLVEPLYSTRLLDWPFLADANVGIYAALKQPPVVPDMFLSLGVEPADDWWLKENRCYFIWEFGKRPDVVVEIVSNDKGEEAGKKLRIYAHMGVPYYVVHDPQQIVLESLLTVYELHASGYLPRPDYRLPEVGLRLTLWQGSFEGSAGTWLRWCDEEGVLVATGAELAEQERMRAEQEHRRAEQERTRAEQERMRAEQEHMRAERLAAKLREMGIDPDAI